MKGKIQRDFCIFRVLVVYYNNIICEHNNVITIYGRILGNITYNDLLIAMPFNNRVGKVTIKGSEIWKAFEHSVHRYNPSIGNGEFLQVSGT